MTRAFTRCAARKAEGTESAPKKGASRSGYSWFEIETAVSWIDGRGDPDSPIAVASFTY